MYPFWSAEKIRETKQINIIGLQCLWITCSPAAAASVALRTEHICFLLLRRTHQWQFANSLLHPVSFCCLHETMTTECCRFRFSAEFIAFASMGFPSANIDNAASAQNVLLTHISHIECRPKKNDDALAIAPCVIWTSRWFGMWHLPGKWKEKIVNWVASNRLEMVSSRFFSRNNSVNCCALSIDDTSSTKLVFFAETTVMTSFQVDNKPICEKKKISVAKLINLFVIFRKSQHWHESDLWVRLMSYDRSTSQQPSLQQNEIKNSFSWNTLNDKMHARSRALMINERNVYFTLAQLLIYRTPHLFLPSHRNRRIARQTKWM